MKNKTIQLRPANINDVETLLKLIRELAEYEKAPEQVLTTEEDLRTSLFDDSPQAQALLAEINQEVVAYAIYFFSYSTWLGKRGVYLEDLYVTPAARGLGAGKALLKELAKTAIANNCGRLEWSVLDWNQPAIEFYESFGAEPQDEWTVYRLTNEALSQFADQE